MQVACFLYEKTNHNLKRSSASTDMLKYVNDDEESWDILQAKNTRKIVLQQTKKNQIQVKEEI